MRTSYFDCETGPLPDNVLESVKPDFKAPANYKDPDKIKASIDEQTAAWKERAALDATTGEVLCVGVGEGLASFRIIEAPTEKEVLAKFWEWLRDELQAGNTVVGFNIFGFDLPFAARRSWITGVAVPKYVQTVFRGRRYWHENLVDVMDVWSCGNREQRVSLDTLSKACGIEGKGGKSGKDFHTLWKQDRKAAVEYVSNDMRMLRRCSDALLGYPPGVNETEQGVIP